MKLEIWVAVDEKDKLIKWHKYPDLLVDGLIGNGIGRVKYICRAEIDGTIGWGGPPKENVMINFIIPEDNPLTKVKATFGVESGDVRMFLSVNESERVFIGWLSSEGTLWRALLSEKEAGYLRDWGFKLNHDKDRIALGNPD